MPLPTCRLPVRMFTRPAAAAVVRVILPDVVVCRARLPLVTFKAALRLVLAMLLRDVVAKPEAQLPQTGRVLIP